MSLGFAGPVLPSSPLPTEHHYRLRIRCWACRQESVISLALGLRRMTGEEVDQRVRAMAEEIRTTCDRCGGQSYKLVAYFPDRRAS